MHLEDINGHKRTAEVVGGFEENHHEHHNDDCPPMMIINIDLTTIEVSKQFRIIPREP